MRIRSDDESAIEIDLAPLIDCVFLLLIFFLVAASLKIVEYEAKIPQRMPAGFSSKIIGENNIVEISEAGRFQWARKRYTVNDPGSLLEGAKKIARDIKSSEIEIRAHPEASSGSVLLLVDALRVAGVEALDVRLVTNVQ